MNLKFVSQKLLFFKTNERASKPCAMTHYDEELTVMCYVVPSINLTPNFIIPLPLKLIRILYRDIRNDSPELLKSDQNISIYLAGEKKKNNFGKKRIYIKASGSSCSQNNMKPKLRTT